MSLLRNNLDRAKAEYHSAVYPGDLASELLTLQIGAGQSVSSNPNVIKPVTSNRWWWAGGLGSAVAAALVVGMFMQATPPPTGVGGSDMAVTPAANPGLMFRNSNLDIKGTVPMTDGANDERFRLVTSPGTRPAEWGRQLEVSPFDINPQAGKFKQGDYTVPQR